MRNNHDAAWVEFGIAFERRDDLRANIRLVLDLTVSFMTNLLTPALWGRVDGG